MGFPSRYLSLLLCIYITLSGLPLCRMRTTVSVSWCHVFTCKIILGSEGKNKKDSLYYQFDFLMRFYQYNSNQYNPDSKLSCTFTSTCPATHQGYASLLYHYLVSVELYVGIYCFLETRYEQLIG